MATFTVPNSQKQIRQNNRSETIGELVETFGIDLSRKFGKLYPSKKLIKVLDEDTHFNSGTPEAFEIFDGSYFIATDSDLYECSLTDDPTDASNWSDVAAVTTTLNFDTDLVVFNDLLLMSNGGNNIYSLNTLGTFANNWATGKIAGLTAAGQMHVHRGGQETLVVCNGNNVKYYNTTGGDYTIPLQSNLLATCVTSGVDTIWVGTESESDGSAYVYSFVVGEVINVIDDTGAIVDTTPAARAAYKVEGTKVMSIEVIDNVPYIITEKGNLQAFNGAGFSTAVSFPFANTTEVINKSSVHPKGMKVHNDSLYINFSSDRRSAVSTDYVTGCPSGIWEYNRAIGQFFNRFVFAETDSDNGARELTGSSSAPIIILDNEYALLLAGAEINIPTGSTSGVFADTGSRFGYFKTIEIESDTVQDAYESIYAKAKTLASGENITIKYRTEKYDPITVTGAMASTTQFNTTSDITGVDENWVAIDIHSGAIAQVVSVTGTTTKQVTLDESFNATGDVCRVEFQRWQKCSEQYLPADGEVKRMGDFPTNPWIQFWVILDGDIEMRQFMVKSNAKNEV